MSAGVCAMNEATNKLFLLPVNGQVEEIPSTVYGELAFKCPRFEWMKERLGVQEIEHVNVLWQGKHCHMFVDEMGWMRREIPPINNKATRIYYNNNFRRSNRQSLIYKDFADNPVPQELHTVLVTLVGHTIVGPVLLWTGEME